jgi:hypothetical protein
MRPDFGYSDRARWETDGKPNGAKVLGCIGSPTFGRRLTVQINEAEYRRVFAALARYGADGILVNDGIEHITNRKWSVPKTKMTLTLCSEMLLFVRAPLQPRSASGSSR